ncbi:MutS protein msh4 [Batrachochytrium dendrobatidis]|nr:MutS protein msh4 [Batrachochytrium dendrobatidis]
MPLVTCLNAPTSALLAALELALNQPSINELILTIDKVINKNVKFEKSAIGLRNQRCFAVRSGFNGLLDVARQTFKEATADVHDLVKLYSNTYNLPIKLVYTPTSQYQMQLREDFISVQNKRLPAEFINSTKKRKQITFTSLKLMSQNDRIQESLTEVYLMGDKIMFDLTAQIREYLSMLYQLSETLALLDMIVSFAAVAKSWNGVRPEFTNTLAIKNGRHPILISMGNTAIKVVPNDVFADSASRLQIITGPNMSGKTTYLRQIALLSILAQIGTFVPAEYISVRLVDCLFSRIGTDDSFEANSSTFMCEMREAAFILSNVTESSLVIIDELGRGTSTSDGFGVCFAICEQLLNTTNAFVFLVTHFEQLAKIFVGADTTGVVVLHLHASTIVARNQDLDSIGMSFSFKVKPGVSTINGYGLLAAQAVGFNADILSCAKKVSDLIQQKKEILTRMNEKSREEKESKKRMQLATRLVQLMRNCTLPEAALRKVLVELQGQKQ